jgi:N-methylhydantoinase A/oxoprolinase/acetone carboxylase beta subunit
MMMNQYVVGIDTGGTYTDGVLMDYRSRKIVSISKTLTTRENLADGITQALEDLHIDDAAAIRLVGISSTLATNSIAERKIRKAGLLLIGYDRDLLTAYNLESKFPTRTVGYFKGGHTTQGFEKEPLDLAGIQEWVSCHHEDIDALAVSAYFSPLNPSHEERTLAMIRDLCSLPVVLGHQLTSKLDSIRRATTACLNASLVAIMHEFIEAVRESLVNLGIDAPLMIVKGDGSLFPYTDAVRRPVETILSGPAASAIGGRFLSERRDALVIDVGGTTTDLVLLDDFKTTLSNNGARVGKFETAVKAARIRTVAIGGDSRISFDAAGNVEVGPGRVVPLSRLVSRFAWIEEEVCALNKKAENKKCGTDIEYWFLNSPKKRNQIAAKNSRHQKLIALLEDGPKSLTQILMEMDKYDALQLNAGPLIYGGIIEQAALTPTDLLHAEGKMHTWCVAAARSAVKYTCALYEKNPELIGEEIFNLMDVALSEEVIAFLGRQGEENELPDRIDGTWGRWFVKEAIRGCDRYLRVTIAACCPIIGIGAPAGIFAKRIADILHAPFILPDYAPVANAVGAVAGSVIVEKEAIVYSRDNNGVLDYVVQVEAENTIFSESEEALDYAEQTAVALARQGAVDAGAVDPQVLVLKTAEGHLQRVITRGIGNPQLCADLSKQENFTSRL